MTTEDGKPIPRVRDKLLEHMARRMCAVASGFTGADAYCPHVNKHWQPFIPMAAEALAGLIEFDNKSIAP